MQLEMTPLTFQHPYLGVAMRNPNTTTIQYTHVPMNKLSLHLLVIKNINGFLMKRAMLTTTHRNHMKTNRSRDNVIGSEVRHPLLAK